jgi:two-component system, OmpR family, KDP operon response regulator KdpE
MTGSSVVLIEDEKQIRRFVRQALEAEGLLVHEAGDVEQGLVEAATRQPDLVILDLGLPGRDGLEFIREFRTWSEMPIVVLSARAEESAKIAALDAGADDYLTKPFGVGELLARVRANLRRRARLGAAGVTQIEFGLVTVDLAARLVSRAGEPVHLTPIEFRLLAHLLANAGKVLTHRQILREVWGPGYAESSHSLRVYMSQLRRKLEEDPARPRHFLTETAIGYRFVPEANPR